MIRMIQRRLIIPRGDTGSFSIPYLKTINAGDVAVFTIFDIRTKTKMYQKLIAAEGDILNIAFTHGDTVNLKPGKYLWDIKFYTNPQIIDDELVNGDEVDSYYAGFSLPECEIRETGDTLLTSDDAPTSTISPESLNIINAAINETLNTKRAAIEAAETATSKASEATEAAENASNSAIVASQSAALAEARVNEIENLSVEVSTGLEGANADVTYTPSTGVLSFVIPRGNTGNGIASCILNNDFTLTINYTNGTSTTTIPIRGDTPHLTIGEVTEGPNAIATITGTDANPILNLTLPNANVPTKLSQLTDDIGVAGKANSADLAAVATSGNYTDLENKPYIPVKTSDLTNDSNYAVDSNYVHTDNNYTTAEKEKLSGIATGAEVNVNADWNATSGDAYILNKPTKVSDFTNDAGYLTQHQDISGKANSADLATIATSGSYNDLLNKPFIPSAVSDLTDDSGHYTKPIGGIPAADLAETYLTSFTETDPTVPSWAKAVNKPTYTAAEVGAPTVAEMNTAIGTAIGQINSFDMAVVQTLPTQDISTHTIYLVPKTGETNDIYDEYVYINNNWEMVGNTQIDLSNYATKDELPDVPVRDVQVNGTSILDAQGVANVPMANMQGNPGVIKMVAGNGIGLSGQGNLTVVGAISAAVKNGMNTLTPIVPSRQHESTFYGLAKAAGADMKDIANTTVGTYPDAQKEAIQSMLGISQMLGPTNPNLVATQAYSIGDVFAANGHLYKATAAIAQDGAIIPDTNCVETTMVEAGGKIKDVQVNSTSIVSNGIADIPIASNSIYGVTKGNPNQGIGVDSVSKNMIVICATDTQVKLGVHTYKPIVPNNQHTSIFYGLSKVAGVDLANETVTLGTYPEASKTAIKAMLGVQDGLKVVRLI